MAKLSPQWVKAKYPVINQENLWISIWSKNLKYLKNKKIKMIKNNYIILSKMPNTKISKNKKAVNSLTLWKVKQTDWYMGSTISSFRWRMKIMLRTSKIYLHKSLKPRNRNKWSGITFCRQNLLNNIVSREKNLLFVWTKNGTKRRKFGSQICSGQKFNFLVICREN